MMSDKKTASASHTLNLPKSVCIDLHGSTCHCMHIAIRA